MHWTGGTPTPQEIDFSCGMGILPVQLLINGARSQKTNHQANGADQEQRSHSQDKGLK
jgi:hypothetical protein